MSAQEEERMKQLLKQALRPVEHDTEPERELWPEVLNRIGRDGQVAPAVGARAAWVWFDVALLAALVLLGVSFPSAIPLLLYYL